MNIEAERRYLDINEINLRYTNEEQGEMIIEGRPILYNKETVLYKDDEYELHEIILPSAASEAIKKNEEVLLWNHDASQPMASKKNQTLQASEDADGVVIRADVSKTIWGRNGYEAIKSGTITSMSFGFYLAADGCIWESINKDGKIIETRKIIKFERIVDYSPVTYPAYKDTTIAARSKDLALLQRPMMMGNAGPDEDKKEQEERTAIKAKINELLNEAERRSRKWKNSWK